MAEKLDFSILELTVLANDSLDETQEHKVLNLALFLELLDALLFFTLFGFFGLDLSIDFGS